MERVVSEMSVGKFKHTSNYFAGFPGDYANAKYVVVGFPFDSTSTYRFGARKAPEAIREASLNIETYSFRTGIFIEDLRIHDLGDIDITGNMNEDFQRLEAAASDNMRKGKYLVIIGGEHSLTYSAIKALPKNTGIISFDAHFDLRDEYAGRKFSHATFMRRSADNIGVDRIFFAGIRAVSKEELDYASAHDAQYLTPDNFKKPNLAMKKIIEFARNFSNIYITLDMDAIDPIFAPGVANPEPGGITPNDFLEVIYNLDTPIIGCDIVETTPEYDYGLTAILAARIIFEVLCSKERCK